MGGVSFFLGCINVGRGRGELFFWGGGKRGGGVRKRSGATEFCNTILDAFLPDAPLFRDGDQR